MRYRIPVLALILLTCLVVPPTLAAIDASDFRIFNIYIGMSEKQFQDIAGDLVRKRSEIFKDAAANDRMDLWQIRRKRDVLVGIDKTTHKVIFVAGEELTKQGASVAEEGDYIFRVSTGMMPIQHDDDWVYHLDRINIAVELQLEAARTGPTVSRFFMADPSLPIKGGYPDGLKPRPGPTVPTVQ